MGAGKHVVLARVVQNPEIATIGGGAVGQAVHQRGHAGVGKLVVVAVKISKRRAALHIERDYRQ